MLWTRALRGHVSEYADMDAILDYVDEAAERAEHALPPVTDKQILEALIAHRRLHPKEAKRTACGAISGALRVPINRVEKVYKDLPADLKGKGGRPPKTPHDYTSRPVR